MIAKLLAFKDVYLSNEDGATVVEYSLIVAGMSLAIATIVFTFGDDLVALFDDNSIDQAGTN